MLIGIDFDGTISKDVVIKQKYAKILFGIDLEPEDCKRKPAALKGINDEMYERLGNLIYSKEITKELPENPEAIKYIKELQKNHEIEVVTSRNETNLPYLQEWLLKRELNLKISATNRKPKIEYVKGMIFFLDDDLKKLEEISDIVKFSCLLASPYNKHETNARIPRVTWNEFYDLISKYKE